jgi:hypothetical protein
MKKAARRKACLISCRELPRWPAGSRAYRGRDGQVAKMAVCAVVYPQTYCSVGIGTTLQIVNKEHGLCGSADVELGGRKRSRYGKEAP